LITLTEKDVVLDDEQYPVYEGDRKDVETWLRRNSEMEDSVVRLGTSLEYVSVSTYLGTDAKYVMTDDIVKEITTPAAKPWIDPRFISLEQSKRRWPWTRRKS